MEKKEETKEEFSKIEQPRTFKQKDNYGVIEEYTKHPNPTESREGILRIKAVLDNP